jgi:hypothetical protein
MQQRITNFRGFRLLDEHIGLIQIFFRNRLPGLNEQLVDVSARQSLLARRLLASGLGVGRRGDEKDGGRQHVRRDRKASRRQNRAGSLPNRSYPFRVQLASPSGKPHKPGLHGNTPFA